MSHSPHHLENQNTTNFHLTPSPIVLQNCQAPLDSTRNPFSLQEHTQSNTFSQTTCLSHSEIHQPTPSQEPGFAHSFKLPSTPQPQPSPTPSSASLNPQHITNLENPPKQPSKSNLPFQKSPIKQKSYQQRQFQKMFNKMSNSTAQKIASESGIATNAFLRRKKQMEWNQKQVEKFMEFYCETGMSRWNGKNQKNTFRNATKKDASAVIEYLISLEKSKTETEQKDRKERKHERIKWQDLQVTNKLIDEHKDLIHHLGHHSLFMENLPPKITYSELEKFLEPYGNINHFLILNHKGRIQSNMPENCNFGKFPLQNSIIGFVEFCSQSSVESMISDMEAKRLRYYAKNSSDTGKEYSNVNESGRRKLSDQGGNNLVETESEEEEGSHHGSRKIEVKKVDWEHMLRSFNKNYLCQSMNQNGEECSNSKINIIYEEETQENLVTQNPLNEYEKARIDGQSEKGQGVMYEGQTSSSKTQSKEVTQKKAINIQKLNSLRSRIKLIKHNPSNKEPSVQIPSKEEQTQSSLKVRPQSKDELKDPELMSIIEEKTFQQLKNIQNNQQQQKNDTKYEQSSKQIQTQNTQKTQTLQKSLQTNPNPFSSQQNQPNSPKPIAARRCHDCESRQKRKITRSIEKQVQITVGINFSSQIPFKASFASYFYEKSSEIAHQRQKVQSKLPAEKKIIQEVSVQKISHVIEEKYAFSPIYQKQIKPEFTFEPIQLETQNESEINHPKQGQPVSTSESPEIQIYPEEMSSLSQVKPIPEEKQIQSILQQNQLSQHVSSEYFHSIQNSPYVSIKSPSPIRKLQKSNVDKQKQFCDESLWESDQGNDEEIENQEKTPSKESNIDKNLEVTSRLLEDGLSASPLINLTKDQEEGQGLGQKDFSIEKKQKSVRISSESCSGISDSSRSSSSSQSSSSSSSSSSKGKRSKKSKQSKKRRNPQKESQSPKRQNKPQETKYCDRNRQSYKNHRYDRNRDIRNDKNSRYQTFDRSYGNEKRRYEREDNNRRGFTRNQSDFRGQVRLRNQQYGNNRIDTRDSWVKGQENKTQRKEKFSSQRKDHEDWRAMKDGAGKKWKYSDYVKSKESPKRTSVKQTDQDNDY